MDDVAAAKEQVSFFSQGREGFSYVVGALRPFDAIDGELDDGDRGAWEHVDEDGPCAVVDAPVVVDGDVRQQGEDVVGEFLAAFGMVLDFVEFLRESVHIIDLARFGIALDVRPAGEPVGGEGKDGLWLLKFGNDPLSDFLEFLCQLVILERNHRASVSGKNNRKFYHDPPFDKTVLIFLPLL